MKPSEIATKLDERAARLEGMASQTDDWFSAMPDDVREGFEAEAAEDRQAAALIRSQEASLKLAEEALEWIKANGADGSFAVSRADKALKAIKGEG